MFKNSSPFLYKMTQVLEEILKGHRISDFSRKWIEDSATDDDTIRAVYEALKRMGLSDSKIASHAHLLGMNPDTINRNYQILSTLGLSDSKIASKAELLSRNPDTINRNYQRLSTLGLSDSKIALHAHLLGRDPDTIDRNYQNHVGLLRQNYQDRNSGKDILLQQAPLLGVSSDTLEANVQWFTDRNLDYGNGVLLGTKPQTKRKKLAWILREVFDYRKHPQDQRREVINNMYQFVADNPSLMIKSTRALERMKDKLIEKATQYR